MGKEGIRNALGDTGQDGAMVTNHKMTTHTQIKPRSGARSSNQVDKKTEEKKENTSKNYGRIPPRPPKTENPFLVSNPFYLDEEEKLRI